MVLDPLGVGEQSPTPTRTQFIGGLYKLLTLEITIFGVEKVDETPTIHFAVAAVQCKKFCPEWLNWPGRLAGISEGSRRISK